MKQGQIAQGDVLLIPTTKAAITKDHKPVDPDKYGRLVLAEGESSGHRHLFRDPGVCMLAREGVSDRVITVVDRGGDDRPSMLLHDMGAETYVPTRDHAPLAVPPGTYIVRMQYEWSVEEVLNALD